MLIIIFFVLKIYLNFIYYYNNGILKCLKTLKKYILI